MYNKNMSNATINSTTVSGTYSISMRGVHVRRDGLDIDELTIDGSESANLGDLMGLLEKALNCNKNERQFHDNKNRCPYYMDNDGWLCINRYGVKKIKAGVDEDGRNTMLVHSEIGVDGLRRLFHRSADRVVSKVDIKSVSAIDTDLCRITYEMVVGYSHPKSIRVDKRFLSTLVKNMDDDKIGERALRKTLIELQPE